MSTNVSSSADLRIGGDHGNSSMAGKREDPNYSKSYVWCVIALLTVVNMFSVMDRMALSILAPSIKTDLQLSDAQLGLLAGLAFSLFYAICAIPIARWADRGNRRDLIAIALVIWSVMTALSGVARNFWHLFGARVGIGAGEAGCTPTAHSMICDYVPLAQRAGVFAIHNFGTYAGMMAGMVVAGWLGETIGWRWTFVALGLPGIALALVVRLTVHEPTRGYFDGGRDQKTFLPLAKVIGVLWHIKTYRLLLSYIVLNGFLQYGLNQWLPSFFSRVTDLELSSIGVSLGLAIGIGSGLGSIVGGLLANKVAERDIKLPLLIGAASVALAAPAALAGLFVTSPTASLLLFAAMAVFWSVSNGPIISTIVSVAPSHMRATAGSVNIFCASVLGFGLGPVFVGWLSDFLAPSFGVESLRYALVAPVCLIPVMALVLWAAARTSATDLPVIGNDLIKTHE